MNHQNHIQSRSASGMLILVVYDMLRAIGATRLSQKLGPQSMPWSIIVFPVEMAIPMNLGIQLFGSFWMMQVRPPNPKPIRPLRLLLFTAETFGLK